MQQAKDIITGNMRKLLQAVILLMLFLPNNALGSDHDPDSFSKTRLSGEITQPSVKSIGSPYLFDNWSPGDVTLYNNETVAGQMLMYNGYQEDLIWLHPTTHQAIRVDKGLVNSFSFTEPVSGSILVFEKITIRPGNQRQAEEIFVQPLYTGSMRLMIRHRVRKTGTTFERTPQGRTIRDQLTYVPEYYLEDKDGTTHFLAKFDRSTFLTIFADNQQEVRQVFHRRFFIPRNDAHRIRLIQELDALLNRR
jgi:hypothetical protein